MSQLILSRLKEPIQSLGRLNIYLLWILFAFPIIFASPLGFADENKTLQEVRYQGWTLPEWREYVKSQSLPALGTKKTVQGLISIITDPSAPWTDRKQFALTLGRIGKPAAAAVPTFQRLLHNSEPDALTPRHWSLKALGLLGRSAEEAAGDVREFVTDRTQPFFIRAAAMESLAKIAPDDPRTLQTLLTVLASDREHKQTEQTNELRRIAAVSLGLLGPAAAPALPEFIRALRSNVPLLQRSVATAIGELGPRGELAIMPLMDIVLFEESADVREAAADALGQIGRPALPALTQLVSDEEQLVRRLAIRGLRANEEKEAARDSLRSRLKDEAPIIRVAAAEAILQQTPNTATPGEGELSSLNREALQTLIHGLQADERRARILAYRSLLEHVDELGSERDALQHLEANPSLSSQTRMAARRLLEKMQPSSTE